MSDVDSDQNTWSTMGKRGKEKRPLTPVASTSNDNRRNWANVVKNGPPPPPKTSTTTMQQQNSLSMILKEDRAKLFPIGANELKKTESIHYTIAEALRLAKLELEINKDSVQSSEKLWLASAMCVKQFAKEQMILLKSHKAIGACVDYIVEETLNTMIWTYFSLANGLHENIYEQTFSLSKVNHYAVSVEKFVFEIAHLQRTMESINFSLNGFPKFASEWPYRCSVKMVKDGGKKFVKIR